MKRVGVIDIGSNSIKCLVAHRSPEGDLLPVFERTLETRISSGIGHGGKLRLRDENMRAALDSIGALHADLMRHETSGNAIVATSAVRDAENGGQFAAQVEQLTGIAPSILSGDEEAELIGRAISEDPNLDLRKAPAFGLLDLGGGSLELLQFRAGALVRRQSFQLGAVRVTEQLIDDPTTPLDQSTRDRVRDHVLTMVRASGFNLSGPLIGTGGAVTVARAILRDAAGPALRTTNPIISRADWSELTDRVCALRLDERARMPHLPEPRADIFPVAMITILAVLDEMDASALRHSFYNLRFGVAAELLPQGVEGA